MKDLSDEDLSNSDLSNEDLRGANLRGADLSHADMWGANLQGADLTNADLTYANLRNADLRGADLTGAWLLYATLDGAKLEGADFVGAFMRYAEIGKANLAGAKGVDTTTDYCWQCRRAITEEEAAKGWPIDPDMLCPSCYGDDAFCTHCSAPTSAHTDTSDCEWCRSDLDIDKAIAIGAALQIRASRVEELRVYAEQILREHVGANVWDWAPRDERDELVNAVVQAAVKAYNDEKDEEEEC